MPRHHKSKGKGKGKDKARSSSPSSHGFVDALNIGDSMYTDMEENTPSVPRYAPQTTELSTPPHSAQGNPEPAGGGRAGEPSGTPRGFIPPGEGSYGRGSQEEDFYEYERALREHDRRHGSHSDGSPRRRSRHDAPSSDRATQGSDGGDGGTPPPPPANPTTRPTPPTGRRSYGTQTSLPATTVSQHTHDTRSSRKSRASESQGGGQWSPSDAVRLFQHASSGAPPSHAGGSGGSTERSASRGGSSGEPRR